MILFVLIVSGWTGAANALYNDKTIKYLNMEQLNEGSLFGFSTAFHTDKRLIISAPKADHIGQVYQCNVQTLKCTQSNITIDDENKRSLKSFTRKNKVQDYPDWWLGATVATGSSFYVVCAPREFRLEYATFNGKPSEHFGSFGQCFIEKGQNDNLVKLQRPKESMIIRNASQIETRMDSFGWSIHVAVDDTLLVGGPAFQAQDRGAVEVYTDPLNQAWDPKLQDFNRRFIGIIKIFYYELDIVQHALGYSVASGNFFSTDKMDLFYAIGTTYGEDGRGMVIFLKNLPKNTMQRQSKEQYFLVTDDVPGSMFAAALCSASLDDDGRMDLLVGAPTRSATQSGGTTTMYNLGAVHVYVSDDMKQLKRKYTIEGEVLNGYFGFAIMNIGDMDGDQRDEVVIGAPYENEGRGAIYLYYGADFNRGTKPKYRQRIQGEGLGYFGFSLTPLKDFDNDGSYGLGVGMPANNSVAIVPFMTIIKVDLFENGPDLQNRETHDSFVFQSCVNIIRPTGNKPSTIYGNLRVSVQINHQYAKLDSPDKSNTFTYDVYLQNAKFPDCRNITVLTPMDGDYSKVIEYIISVTQVEDLRQDSMYNSSKALLLDRPENMKHAYIWAATDCKTMGECKPVLDMSLESTAADPYMVGSTDSETITVRVYNTGETAYTACVVIRPIGVSVLQTTPFCKFDGDHLKCSPLGPIRNVTWDLGNIVLDTTSLTSLDKEVSIMVTLYNQCKNINSTQKTENITWTLTHDTKGVDIERKALRGRIVKMTEDDIYYKGKHFEHMYSIVNTGTTKWVGLNFTIEIEKQPYYADRPPKIHSMSYSACAPNPNEKNDSKTHQVICPLGELDKTKIDILFTIDILPGKLGAILPYKNVTVSTNFTQILDNVTKTKSITTTIMLQKAKVPLWIIFAACLFGLALLGFIGFILYECGLLRRKKKEDLKDLKRRASVRMSMRESARSSMAAGGNRASRSDTAAPRMSMAELQAAIAANVLDKNATRSVERSSRDFNEVETNFEDMPLKKHEVEVHNDGKN